MSIHDNKAVVRRFLSAISSGGNIDLIDELVAPNYLNRGMGNVDLTAFKAMLSGMQGASRFDIEDVVAEGDAVVVRSTMNIALASGMQVCCPGSHLLPSRRRQDRGGRHDDHA